MFSFILSVSEVHLRSFSHCALNSACVDPDRMSHFERSERAGRQGQRRKHHRWSGPDNFHNDNRLVSLERFKNMLPEKKWKYSKVNITVFLSAWLFFFCLRAHVFQHYDGLKASKFSSRPVPSEGRQHGYIAMLDELTLEHMTQDCSSLKNQLLRLKTLLQVRPTFINNYTHAATHTCVRFDTCTNTLMCVQYELSSDRTLWPVYVASPFEYVTHK